MKPAGRIRIVPVSSQATDIRLPVVFEGFFQELLRCGVACAKAMKDSDR